MYLYNFILSNILFYRIYQMKLIPFVPVKLVERLLVLLVPYVLYHVGLQLASCSCFDKLLKSQVHTVNVLSVHGIQTKIKENGDKKNTHKKLKLV